VPSGTVILAGDGLYTPELKSKGVHSLADHVYITGMSEAEASEIGKTAEQMGLMVSGIGGTALTKLRYWAPLLEVSSKHGY
jgi:hypothetical protein